jgi:hypothetical protein
MSTDVGGLVQQLHKVNCLYSSYILTVYNLSIQ